MESLAVRFAARRGRLQREGGRARSGVGGCHRCPGRVVVRRNRGSAASAAASADSGFSATLSNELGRLGFSTATSALVALGKDRGLLLSGLGRLAGHATALSAIFDNDRVVSAFMKRPDMQDVCRDPEKMKPKKVKVEKEPAKWEPGRWEMLSWRRFFRVRNAREHTPRAP